MARKKGGKPTIREVVDGICAGEGCGKVDALMIYGLRAVLAGMSRMPACYEHLILKGGTALHLAIQEPLGRISTDLDLSLIDATKETFDPRIISDDVAREIVTVLSEALLDPAQVRISTPMDATAPKHPHLPALYRYRLVVEANLGSPTRTVANANGFQIELAVDELVDPTALEELTVAPHGLPIRMRMYAPVQAIAEKLRALLQKHQHYDRTGVAGSFNPRHVLDLLPLSRRMMPEDRAKLRPLFHLKCERRQVPPAERTVARMTNAVLRDQVDRSMHPWREQAWALLLQFAEEVCCEPDGVSR
jgi:predicted nucleotidyltransferase component of viral defense system